MAPTRTGRGLDSGARSRRRRDGRRRARPGHGTRRAARHGCRGLASGRRPGRARGCFGARRRARVGDPRGSGGPARRRDRRSGRGRLRGSVDHDRRSARGGRGAEHATVRAAEQRRQDDADREDGHGRNDEDHHRVAPELIARIAGGRFRPEPRRDGGARPSCHRGSRSRRRPRPRHDEPGRSNRDDPGGAHRPPGGRPRASAAPAAGSAAPTDRSGARSGGSGSYDSAWRPLGEIARLVRSRNTRPVASTRPTNA